MADIDWLDIGLHVLGASLVAGILGHHAGMSLRTGRWYGVVGAVACAAAGILGVGIFWLSREQGQHGGNIGGIQSQLEWIMPAIAAPFMFWASMLAAKSRR